MWQEILDHISRLFGDSITEARHYPISGGSINQTYQLVTPSYRFFVKINRAEKMAMFEAEALALQAIKRTQTIRVPEPIGWGIADHNAYLVMEWLDLDGPQNWQKLAEQLAALHRLTNPSGFGWTQTNTIGETIQPNPWTVNWYSFFWQHRLQHQLKLADRRGFSLPDNSAEKLHSAVEHLLVNHHPSPALVHGDLWGGNVSFDSDGNPVIFDPALYYGDREVDLAMTELFGGFSPHFYKAYQEVFPLKEEYTKRKPLYNLYHILNHFNLFGGSYAGQAQKIIEELIGS